MYVPALKPLRERALIFRLEPPSLSSLVARLNWICKQEGVQVFVPIFRCIFHSKMFVDFSIFLILFLILG
jgi:DNA polymerase III delta prime subunit